MSSILTNNSAMVALQTLKSINNDLSKVQSQISTGKNITSAKDNSAVWAISKVMESDVAGFKGISDSLSLGQSTVSVARQAAETVTNLLTQMKDKIVAAQESNVDRAKIQTDVVALRNQIQSVVGAAQFNGLNLLQNNDSTLPGTINVLSSLDRSGTGVVASDIAVSKIDLGTQESSFDTTGSSAVSTIGTAASLGVQATGPAGPAIGTTTLSGTITAGTVYTLNIGVTAAVASAVPVQTYNSAAAVTVAQAEKYSYVAAAGDTAETVAKALVDKFNAAKTEAGVAAGVLDLSTNGSGVLSASSTATNTTNTITINFATITNTENEKSEGGLSKLTALNVTTEEGADTALEDIEGMIQNAIDAAAAFGSIEKRIETQAKFITSLSDALKSGIGTLVDANMEEASARLQALQVQQQLGIQALSIANQAPQSLLSLFRG